MKDDLQYTDWTVCTSNQLLHVFDLFLYLCTVQSKHVWKLAIISSSYAVHFHGIIKSCLSIDINAFTLPPLQRTKMTQIKIRKLDELKLELQKNNNNK